MIEEFIKKSNVKHLDSIPKMLTSDKITNQDNLYIKRMIVEEEVQLNQAELDRMERICNVLISNSQKIIDEQTDKLIKLRELRTTLSPDTNNPDNLPTQVPDQDNLPHSKK